MILQKLTNILARYLGLIPPHRIEILFVWILSYTPLFVLSRLPFSYGIYARCFPMKKGSIVLDCGAHIGNCAILFSRIVGPNGLVICIEPFRDSYLQLIRRTKKLRLGNVITINKGIWAKSGILPLEIFQETISCKLSSGQLNLAADKNAIAIECTTIDELVNELNLNKLDFIKMDIEGAEIEALQGATRTLTELRPRVAIASYHHREGKPTSSTVEKILGDFNYNYKTFFPPHLTTCGKPK